MCSTSAVGFLSGHFPVTSSTLSPPPTVPPCVRVVTRSSAWNPLTSLMPGFGTLEDRHQIDGRQIVTCPRGLFKGVDCAVTSKYADNSSATPILLPKPRDFPLQRSSGSFSVCHKSFGRSKTALGAAGEGANSSKSTEAATEVGVYQGAYGSWTVEASDIKEVILYRSGLVAVATSFVIASSSAFLNESEIVNDLIRRNLDLFYALGGCGLGLSLYLIHIYVKEIKQTLQALWLIGILGSVATYASLAHPMGKGLVEYVVENHGAVWFVGPLFAALTGLVFKEGLCYGKLEAGVLTFIIPSLLLGHLTGLMDDGTKLALLGVWMALFVVFAGRKFTQPIKDDIGDKSVFIFNALPPEEKAALVEKLEQQNYNQNLN